MNKPQVLGSSSENDFKAYFFRHYVRRVVMACRCGVLVRVMFYEQSWTHTFWHDGESFDLYRAERLPWILEVLQRPEEIRVDREPKREAYLLTENKWGEYFVVIVEATKRHDCWRFITAYPLDLRGYLIMRCYPDVCSKKEEARGSFRKALAKPRQ